jgi:hypothetical protein
VYGDGVTPKAVEKSQRGRRRKKVIRGLIS